MKILWLTTMLPCLRSGGQVRQWQMFRHLVQRHHIRVISLLQPQEESEVAPLRALGVELDTLPFQPREPHRAWENRVRSWSQLLLDPHPAFAHVFPIRLLRERVNTIAAGWQPDVVHMEHLFTAPLSAGVSGIPWVLQETNVESQLSYSQLVHERRLARRIFGRIEELKLRRWERAWVRRADACVAVSELDAKALRAMAPGTPVSAVPNGVATDEFAPPAAEPGQRDGLLFFGTLAYGPNGDALQYFCREILPAVRQQAPAAKLRIIGSYATPDIVALGAQPGVEYVGFVPDVRPYLWSAAVCVVPLRSGGGTRLKILEALAAGCPVVSTTKGAEGLDLQPGYDFVQADDPESFAAATVRLLHEPDYRRTLAAQGQASVRGRYDWAQVAPGLERAYQLAVQRKPARQE